jgi:hypothetical protein
MPNTIVPYNELLRNAHTSLLKDLEWVVCIWFSKFLKPFSQATR